MTDIEEQIERAEPLPSFRMGILELRPGDKLVISYPGRVRAEAVAMIKAAVNRWAGREVDVMILQEGLEMGVVRGLEDAE